MAYNNYQNIYQNKKCARCELPAVGMARDDYGQRYYCDTHFRAYEYVWNKEQDAKELLQFGDQDWYREATGLPLSSQQILAL